MLAPAWTADVNVQYFGVFLVVFFAVTIFIFNASCMVGSLITTLITSAQETSHRGNSKWQQELNLLIQRKEKNHV